MQRNKASISDYYNALRKSFEESIVRSPDEYIRNTETSKIVSDLLKSRSVLLPVEFDPSRKETMRHEKEMRKVSANMRDGFHRHDGDLLFEYETIWITIPVVSNPSIQTIQDLGTSTYSLSWSPDEFNWGNDKVTLSVDIKGYGFKFEDEKIVNEVASLKKHMTDWVGWVNTDINQGNAMLEKELVPVINDRKQKLIQDESRLNTLSDKMGISLE